MDDARLALEDALFKALRESLGPFAWVTYNKEPPRRNKVSDPLHILKSMLALGHLKATDLRDKVFGCMGMFPVLMQMVPVDYDMPVTNLYAATTSCFTIALESLEPLCYFQAWSMPGLPSWSLRFDRGIECNEELPKQFRVCPPSDGSEDWEYPILEIESGSAHKMRLSVNSVYFDEVESCHATRPDWDAYYATYSLNKAIPDLRRASDYCLSITHHFLCHRRWRTFFGLDSDNPSHTAYVGGGTTEEAYYKTAAFGLRCTKSKALKRLGRHDIKSYLEFVRNEVQQDSDIGNGNELRALAQEYELAVLDATARDYGPLVRGEPSYGTCFYKTKRGYFGLALYAVRPGDHVYILDRATLPMVLRPHIDDIDSKQTVFEVMSTCYVHGIMQGEAFGPRAASSSLEGRRHNLRKMVFAGEDLDQKRPLEDWKRVALI